MYTGFDGLETFQRFILPETRSLFSLGYQLLIA